MAKENITLGRGDLYFAKRSADGSLGGFRKIGNTPNFGVTINTEYLKHYNSSRGVRTQDREVPVQTDYSAQFVTDNVSPDNLAALFQGSTSVIATAGQANVVQTLVDVERGLAYQIGVSPATPSGVRKISVDSVMVGAAAKVAGVDYELNAARGLITILETGTIVAGDDVIVTYDVAAHSRQVTVTGADAIEGGLMFLAYNPEGDDIDYRMLDAKLAPNGEFAIKADEWQQLPFTVAISTPDGGSAILADGQPYTA